MIAYYNRHKTTRECLDIIKNVRNRLKQEDKESAIPHNIDVRNQLLEVQNYLTQCVDNSYNDTVEFIVHGEPVAKGRPRFTKTGKPYTPAKTENYENLVKLEYINQCGRFCFGKGKEIAIELKAYFPIPKSTSKKKATEMGFGHIRPTKRPDGDNILKAITDALNRIAYYDDSQIVEATVKKYYSLKPRVEVAISDITYTDKTENESLKMPKKP